MQRQTRKNNQLELLQLQFANHCATIIQSHFKGYIQRKRYRLFLPAYRRFREILLAGFQGWKTRKIMSLQSIQLQKIAIKEKNQQKQMSSVRISKRQLIDDIQRLRKRGKWVEYLKKERNFRKNGKRKDDSKENSSLYGNIKPQSLKNMFKPNLEEVKNIPIAIKNNEKSKIESSVNRQISTNKKVKSMNFDEIQLKSPKDFYALLEEQLMETKPQSQKNKLKSKEKSGKNDKNKKTMMKKKAKGDEPEQKKPKVISLKSFTEEGTDDSINVGSDLLKDPKKHQHQLTSNFPETPSSAISSQNFQNFQTCRSQKPKKLKITLSKRKQQEPRQCELNTFSSSINLRQKIVVDPLMEKSVHSPVLGELLKTFKSTYREKKRELIQKLTKKPFQDVNQRHFSYELLDK